MLPHSALASTAVISPCGQYRYELRRRWQNYPTRFAYFVMLNPSTADATVDDPTIGRCINFAIREGNDALCVVNLFALRSRHPQELSAVDNPHGPLNSIYLRAIAMEAHHAQQPIILAWGASPFATKYVVAQTLKVFKEAGAADFRCLGYNKNGSPKHPLYVLGDAPLVPFK